MREFETKRCLRNAEKNKLKRKKQNEDIVTQFTNVFLSEISIDNNYLSSFVAKLFMARYLYKTSSLNNGKLFV